MFFRKLRTGDPVIYRLTKHSSKPGPRAKNIEPARRGDDYAYQVDKYWVVQRVLDGGQLLLRTRRGKAHVVDPNDRNLRKPSLWERLVQHRRFPQPSEIPES